MVLLSSTNLTVFKGKTGNQGWDEMLIVQCFADLFFSAIVFSANYFFYAADQLTEILIHNYSSV